MSTFKDAVQKKLRQFEAHFRAGDIQELVEAYYVEEPVLISPPLPIFAGKQATASYFQGAKEIYDSCTLESGDMNENGDKGYEAGVAQLTFANSGTIDVIRYLVYWRYTDADGWRAAVDFFWTND